MASVIILHYHGLWIGGCTLTCLFQSPISVLKINGYPMVSFIRISGTYSSCSPNPNIDN